jgi:hypothetical protein
LLDLARVHMQAAKGIRRLTAPGQTLLGQGPYPIADLGKGDQKAGVE